MVHLENDGFLVQLGYPANAANKAKLHKVIANTAGFDKIERHLIQLNDTLKSFKAYVTLSNNQDLLKIKKDTDSEALDKKIDSIVQSWAQKYKVKLLYQPKNRSYYIQGRA